jgi:UDP-N-acetylmuramate dehydrogenase
MNIQENVSLSGHSTMRLGGPARYLADITDRFQIAEALAWAEERQLPVMMIGGGSNIIWSDQGFSGLVLVNKIPGFETQVFDDQTTFVTVGGGEAWDSVVARTVDMGLSGIELLSKIPGTAGAGPVQNIGAYGSQLSDTLVTLEAFDTQTKQLVTLRASDCAFGYRTSRFKTTDRGRFFITSITLRLGPGMAQPPYYKDIQAYIDNNQPIDLTLPKLRDIVGEIRQIKLPDPSTVANTGSFFQNPIISRDTFDRLVAQHPEIEQTPPGWSQPPRWLLDNGQVKIGAGWLVEQVGFKGLHDPETGMATWDKQALVLVNEHARSTADLLRFKQKIVDAVQAKFGLTLVQEPELVSS